MVLACSGAANCATPGTDQAGSAGGGDEQKALAALADIIAAQQKKHVRESWGEWAHECFTEIDLKEFVRTGVPGRIAEDLRRSRRFIEVVLAFKQVPADRREKQLNACRRPLRKTWAQLGRISREGQTEAGQKAERMIAEVIVDEVRKLVDLPQGDLKALWTKAR
ncbi:MAG: hypothetical protein AAB654_09635 [Acidobacteriota bacterium]